MCSVGRGSSVVSRQSWSQAKAVGLVDAAESEVCEGGRRRREEDGLACSVLQGIGNIRPVTAVRATMPVIPFCHPFPLD